MPFVARSTVGTQRTHGARTIRNRGADPSLERGKVASGMARMRRTAWTMCALFLVGLLSPAQSMAQPARSQLSDGKGMDLRLFRPALDSKGILSINGSDILGDGDMSFGLVLDAGFGILPFNGFKVDNDRTPADAEETDRIVDQFFTGTLHFNYGFLNQFVVGVQLPVTLANGPNVVVPDHYNDTLNPAGLNAQGIGNITLHGKMRLTRVERTGIGLAALLHIELPTGDESRFQGDGFALWPVLAAEYRPHRRFRVAANLGYRFNTVDGASFPVDGATQITSTNVTTFTLADQGTTVTHDDSLTFGLGLAWRMFDSVELAAETYGTQLVNGFGDEHTLSAEAIGGLKIFVERNSFLMVGGGVGLRKLGGATDGYQEADYRAVLGFVFEPSIGDRDGDGLKDDVDQCPDEPEDFDDFADEDGCPDPDNDRDGILDVDDECPLIPEDRDGDEDEDGCPEGNFGDRDGDGILDAEDQCPDDPEDRDGFQDEDGCPEPDNDQDGILDADDLCPNDPEDHDNFQDEDGCPDPDNDRDRILDVDDACPVDPETYNGKDDEDGCPDQGSVIIEDNQIVILEKIYFETDSARILPRSFPIIDAVAATLNGNPQITKIEVQGHADERGADEYNVRLTHDRAASVVEALIARGVSRTRVRSSGYGEHCPIDPNSHATAWEKNRRVEFKILETEDGPTGVEVACQAGSHLVPRD